MWSSVSIFNLWLSVSCGRPFHPSFVAAPTVPEVILNLISEWMYFFLVSLFFLNIQWLCVFILGTRNLSGQKYRPLLAFNELPQHFPHTPCRGGGFQRVVSTKKKNERETVKLRTSEHVRAIVHAHCAHPACLSAWGRHYNIHDNTSRGLWPLSSHSHSFPPAHTASSLPPFQL